MDKPEIVAASVVLFAVALPSRGPIVPVVIGPTKAKALGVTHVPEVKDVAFVERVSERISVWGLAPSRHSSPVYVIIRELITLPVEFVKKAPNIGTTEPDCNPPKARSAGVVVDPKL